MRSTFCRLASVICLQLIIRRLFALPFLKMRGHRVYIRLVANYRTISSVASGLNSVVLSVPIQWLAFTELLKPVTKQICL